MKAAFKVCASACARIVAVCMLCSLLSGCGLWSRRHSPADPAAAAEAKKPPAWLEALRVDRLRDERALEVERHLGGS